VAFFMISNRGAWPRATLWGSAVRCQNRTLKDFFRSLVSMRTAVTS